MSGGNVRIPGEQKMPALCISSISFAVVRRRGRTKPQQRPTDNTSATQPQRENASRACLFC